MSTKLVSHLVPPCQNIKKKNKKKKKIKKKQIGKRRTPLFEIRKKEVVFSVKPKLPNPTYKQTNYFTTTAQ